ncbi:AMP nucleosidase [Parvibaculum sedimenti]|uniref:AMP nucleosidase n=1 Tax=Parvibaculum sedimenti TaxID=2608632 RepID=A0A6N6VLK9_9HYPH|nr:AMP nucleosidase [Parvibaculum sedimenti]KAB7739507.1 AMP nucleosidase [Parvibaculum sedimenti]
MADETKTSNLPERITVLAREFTPAAMEFHRRNMSEKGYRMEGQIVQRRFQMIEGLGAPKDLFDGELFYAATFVRKGDEQ